MASKEIALAIAAEHETVTKLKWSIEVNGLFKQNVYDTFIILWTERQDREGNWWHVKNAYCFEEEKFDLNHYFSWRQITINKSMAE